MNIIIDNQPHDVPESVLTVRGIFLLGQKPEEDLENYELIRITDGQEDVLYSRTQKPASTLDDEISLQDGEVFSIFAVANGQITLIVQSEQKPWDKKEISYGEVVKLAYGNYDDNPEIVYTINYFDGPDNNKEGSLVKGKQVPVADKMIFNVTRTDKS